MDYTEKIEVCVSSVKINLYEESLKTLDDSEYPGVKETLKELILENHPDEMIPLALDTPTFIRDKFKFRYQRHTPIHVHVDMKHEDREKKGTP